MFQSFKKYARANNKYMGNLHDPKSPSTFLWYVDATNLNGYEMTQRLPLDGIQWVNGAQDDLK